MASARKRGQRWTGLYRDASGAQKSAGTYGTREEALSRATVAEIDANPREPAQIHPLEKRGKITVAAFGPRWLASLLGEPNTIMAYGLQLRHVIASMGDLAVADVEDADIKSLIRHMQKRGLSGNTIRNALIVARGMFRAAVPKIRADNPCDGIKFTVKDQHEMLIATREQAKAIQDAVAGPHKLLVRALFATGCRWGEMIAVRGTDIERRGNGYVLRVRRSIGETYGTGLYERNYGKTAKAKRDITIPESLALELLASGDALCFTSPAGGYLRRSYFRDRAWKPAVKKAGIPGLRVHDTRHSHASWLANDPAVPLASVRDRLGHSSIAVTSKYVHIMPGDDPCLAALGEAA